MPTSLRNPRRILAIKLRALGDTVLLTASLDALKKAYPEAQIDVVVSKPWAPLLENHPAVSRVFPYERRNHAASRAKAIARLALSLRRTHYDAAINFHASPSSSTLALASGARVRSIHFHGHRDKNRYSTVVVPGKGVLKPNIERDLDAIRALGLDIPKGALPRVYLRHEEIATAQSRLQRLGLPGPILGLGLGASRPTKSWPIERFALLAVEWIRKTGGSAMAFCSPEELSINREFLRAADDLLSSQIKDTVDRAEMRTRIFCEGDLDLRSLGSIQSLLSVFVGNDSGPRHLALAVGTPTVTIFGPEDPFEWHPYPQDQHPYLYVEGLPCRRDAEPGMPPWCGLHVCVEQEHKCMRKIGVESVLERAMQVMRVPVSLGAGRS